MGKTMCIACRVCMGVPATCCQQFENKWWSPVLALEPPGLATAAHVSHSKGDYGAPCSVSVGARVIFEA